MSKGTDSGQSPAGLRTYGPAVCRRAILSAIGAGVPVLLTGPPGVGKSALMGAIAREYAGAGPAVDPHLYLRDQRLATMDPVDLRGLPRVVDGRTDWTTPAFWVTDEDVAAGKAKERGLVFLDEVTSIAPSMQVAAYQLLRDRVAPSGARLAPGWGIVAAGNRVTDGAVAVKLSSALANRLLHLDMEPSLDDWATWAAGAGIAAEVIAFVRTRPALLWSHSATERAFPTPRTWEMVSNLIRTNAARAVEMALIEGTVGAGAAAEFGAFLSLSRALPPMDSILQDPDGAEVPNDPSALYAVAYGIACRVDAGTFAAGIRYLDRCPEEYSVLAVKHATQRDPKLTGTTAFVSWATSHAGILS